MFLQYTLVLLQYIDVAKRLVKVQKVDNSSGAIYQRSFLPFCSLHGKFLGSHYHHKIAANTKKNKVVTCDQDLSLTHTPRGSCFTLNNFGELASDPTYKGLGKVPGIGIRKGLSIVLDNGLGPRIEALRTEEDTQHIPLWIHSQAELPDVSGDMSLTLEVRWSSP